MENRRCFGRWLIPAAVSIVIIAVFFHDLRPGEIYRRIREIPAPCVIGFFLSAIAAVFLRAWRYHILLDRQVGLRRLLLVTLTRNAAVDLLPAHSAALVLYTWLNTRQGASVETAAASFIISTIYDISALAIFLAVAAPGFVSGLPLLLTLAGLIAAAIAAFLIIHSGAALLQTVTKKYPLNRFPRLLQRLAPVRAYLLRRHSPREQFKLLGISLAIRAGKYLSVFMLFAGALDLPFSPSHLTRFCFGLAGTELSSLSPIQGLAGFGTWELAFTAVFSSFQFAAENLRETGFAIHLITQTWEYAAALPAFLILMAMKRRQPKTPPSQTAAQ